MNTHAPIRAQHLTRPRSGVRMRAAGYFGHRILDRLDRGLDHGTMEMMLPDGSFRILGGRGDGPKARISLTRWRALLRLAQQGSEGGYRGWDAGDWDSVDLVAVFELFARNRRSLAGTARASGLTRLAKQAAHWLHRNTRRGAKRNILAHYDLGNDFYAAWLDETLTYSAALFLEPMNGEEALGVAQKRKVQALGQRLQLKPASDILEIGSGWGYFSRQCAKKGHRVTAITLSPLQKRHAEAAAAKLDTPPAYHLRDYRDVTGQYDTIASVEMVEAVGQQYWPVYLDMIARSLRPGGRAAIQFISMAEDVFADYAAGMDFIQTHIFPGGMLLSESRFRALAEARGLSWEAPLHFGAHYAETLRRWHVRFDDAVAEGRLPKGFDDRFVRLWRFYLMYCEGAFRGGAIDVAQVTLVKAGG